MHWFSSKEFPQDYVVDVIDEDMVLETLLNDNPTRIRRYPEEFLGLIGLSRMWYAYVACPVFYNDDEDGSPFFVKMRLQDFIKVPNPFDVVCAEKKLSKDEKPILEHTADVVTLPSDQIMGLSLVLLDQVFSVASLPPPTNARKRAPVQAPARES
ncbi:hypothetical protein Tco_1574195, partial [Tanacetum coccineum]